MKRCKVPKQTLRAHIHTSANCIFEIQGIEIVKNLEGIHVDWQRMREGQRGRGDKEQYEHSWESHIVEKDTRRKSGEKGKEMEKVRERGERGIRERVRKRMREIGW